MFHNISCRLRNHNSLVHFYIILGLIILWVDIINRSPLATSITQFVILALAMMSLLRLHFHMSTVLFTDFQRESARFRQVFITKLVS